MYSQQVHHGEQAVDDVFLVLLVVIVAQFEREQNIFADRERIEQRAGLEHHGHFLADAAQFGFVGVGDVGVGDDDAAVVGLEESHDVAQAHGLADAAAADDGQGLAGIHVKVGID